MAEEFEVHGPHDHELEHAAHGGDDFSSRIAVMTAIMATAGAIFGFQAGSTQNEAALFKNEAGIVKTEAADQWNFYQSKSNKQNLAELAVTMPGVDVAKYQADIARYKTEKEEIKKHADELEKSSKEWNEKSAEVLHQHHRWAQAMTALQIAISLAAITLLTRKSWMQVASYSVAGIGVVLAVCAWFQI
ncbi:coenzyme F420-reducing hydrogenase alpha subunit [Oxalobacteraceae bacterium GrIS 1.18]